MAVHSVGIGELQVSSDPSSSLSALGLGSCVAVLLYESFTGTGGMAHCMLPTRRIRREEREPKPAMCVDTGLLELLRAMADAGVRPRGLRAVLVGGASMFEFAGAALPDVGAQNAEMARSLLAAERIPVVASDLGGHRGRTVTLQLAQGEVMVRSETRVHCLARLRERVWAVA